MPHHPSHQSRVADRKQQHKIRPQHHPPRQQNPMRNNYVVAPKQIDKGLDRGKTIVVPEGETMDVALDIAPRLLKRLVIAGVKLAIEAAL